MAWGKKIIIDGIQFDSRMEGSRYVELKTLQRGGLISDLKCHVQFDFIVNGYKVGAYKIDFTYFDKKENQLIGEEVKGRITRDFPLRRNLFIALFPEYKFVLNAGRKVIMHLPKKVKSKI